MSKEKLEAVADEVEEILEVGMEHILHKCAATLKTRGRQTEGSGSLSLPNGRVIPHGRGSCMDLRVKKVKMAEQGKTKAMISREYLKHVRKTWAPI